MEDTYQAWLWGKTAERCVKNLKKNGFDAHFVENVAEAKTLILEMVSSYKTFGFGGSEHHPGPGGQGTARIHGQDRL